MAARNSIRSLNTDLKQCKHLYEQVCTQLKQLEDAHEPCQEKIDVLDLNFKKTRRDLAHSQHKNRVFQNEIAALTLTQQMFATLKEEHERLANQHSECNDRILKAMAKLQTTTTALNSMKRVNNQQIRTTSLARKLCAFMTPTLGLVVDDAPKGGVLLTDVKRKAPCPANDCGLKKGDIVTEVNGDEVPTKADLLLALRNYKPGDELALLVSRGALVSIYMLTVGAKQYTDMAVVKTLQKLASWDEEDFQFKAQAYDKGAYITRVKRGKGEL